jgi:trigger factor
MNIEQHQIDSVHAELSIQLDPADYNARFEQALKNYRKQAQMPGFRPGHVPASLIRKRFGKALLAEEINQVLEESINRYITENKLQILGSPLPKDTGEVGDWEHPEAFSFTYELGLAPEIKVELDSTQKFIYHKVDVNEELVNKQVRDYARRFGKMSQPETSGAEDLLTLSLFELDESGVPLEGGIAGSTQVAIDNLKDETLRSALIGVGVGAEVAADPQKISFDHEEIAKMLNITHNDVHQLHTNFRARVTDIRHIEPAELNEELFEKVFPGAEIADVEAFRSKVKMELESMFESDSNWYFGRTISRELVERTAFDLPDAFLKKWIVVSSDDPIDEQALEHEYPMYAASMRWDLIQAEVIRRYELKVSMEESLEFVKNSFRQRFASYGIPMSEDQLENMAKETLGKREELRKVYDMLMQKKVVDYIRTNCSIEEKILPYEEFVHLIQH